MTNHTPFICATEIIGTLAWNLKIRILQTLNPFYSFLLLKPPPFPLWRTERVLIGFCLQQKRIKNSFWISFLHPIQPRSHNHIMQHFYFKHKSDNQRGKLAALTSGITAALWMFIRDSDTTVLPAGLLADGWLHHNTGVTRLPRFSQPPSLLVPSPAEESGHGSPSTWKHFD